MCLETKNRAGIDFKVDHRTVGRACLRSRNMVTLPKALWENQHLDLGRQSDEGLGEGLSHLEGVILDHNDLHGSRQALNGCWIGHAESSPPLVCLLLVAGRAKVKQHRSENVKVNEGLAHV
jgi:hypothetical protein